MRKYLSKNSRLVSTGILEDRRGGLWVSDHIQQYLAGLSEMDIIDNLFKRVPCDDALPLEEHTTVPEKNREAIKALLESRRGCNILLFGKPGTGKTEFPKSLAKHLDRSVFYINGCDEDGKENLSWRKSAVVAAQNVLEENSIIVVDECDPMLNTQPRGFPFFDNDRQDDPKAWINGLLEKSRHKIIWITNQTDSIDVSTKRRFSFSQEFRDFTVDQRIRVWEAVIEKHAADFLGRKDIEYFASRYRVNAGGIALAVEDSVSMGGAKGVCEKKYMLETILGRHERFVFGKGAPLAAKTKTYDIEVLNTDTDPREIASKLKHFKKYIGQCPEEDRVIRNLSLLFYGPAGSGKTEFAKFLSEEAGLEILFKRSSDIRSKWYGESEKNIASMFGQAEEEGKILFMDEADSFFVNRRKSASHFAAKETNELLTGMENFGGILICATNMIDILDAAVLRRFTYKVSFDFLDEGGKAEMFRKCLRDKCRGEPTAAQMERLGGIGCLTPGDFKVVAQKHFFHEPVAVDTLLEDLRKEAALKRENGRRIGF